MARAFGSYPECRWFKSDCRYHYEREALPHLFIKGVAKPLFIYNLIWPGGQVVKTPPFHGGNTGSSPVRVTTKKHSANRLGVFYLSKMKTTTVLPYK